MRDANSLRCLLDDDADAVKLASRRRFRSLAVSISLQALFIAVLVVAPLLATGKLQLENQWQSPLPPYRATPPADAPPTNSGPRQRPNTTTATHTAVPRPVPPREIPDEIAIIDDRAADPSVSSVPPGGGCPGCSKDGLLDFIGPSQRGPQPPMLERPEPAPIARPVIVSRMVQEAKLIHRVDPNYPPLCKHARLEGTVVLRAVIGRDGTMRELTYVSGPACFVQHSLNAVAQWRYRPTILNGGPVEVETSITVIYKLNR